MWYVYRQNNSGGSFQEPALFVLIEADSASDANTIAQSRALLYFDGVENAEDCECCGDRWYRLPTEQLGYTTLREFYTDYLGSHKYYNELALSDNIPTVKVFSADGTRATSTL
jgi:hypothetical protein